MKHQNKNRQVKDIQILNQDSNKILADFLTITVLCGSVVNFVSRGLFTDQNKVEILALSIVLILLGYISFKLKNSKLNSFVITHILSLMLFFIVISIILLFEFNGGVTVWAISLLCLIIGVVSENKTAIIYNSVAAISVEIYLWINHPSMLASLDTSDYITRIGIYLIAVIIVYIVNNMLVERARKNFEQIEDIKAKNNEIITLQKEIYKLVSESTSDGIWKYDLRDNKQMYSQWWLNTLGYAEDEIISMKDWFSLVHKNDLCTIQNNYNNYLKHNIGHYENECRMLTKEGNYLWIKAKIKALFDNKGSPYMIVGAYTNITPLKEREERLHKLAFYDALTGLPNRQHFLDHLHLSLEKAAKEGTSLYVVFIDLDNFKKVNDSMGHLYGDVLLKEVSSRFNQIVQKPCFLGRLAGDEFAITINGFTELHQVESFIKRLINSLSTPIMLNNTNYITSASFGISTFPKDGNTVDELLNTADTAMYRAKEAGKNSFNLFNKAL
ncbi:MAG: sensor domain-containing diguanylate cyclase [Clostridia bacterium]|nr:sensor domain-containing diguanylate cyclase [Clostridia bacterium]